MSATLTLGPIQRSRADPAAWDVVLLLEDGIPWDAVLVSDADGRALLASQRAADCRVDDLAEPYGVCPHCGACCASRDRRPGGNDHGACGHCYPTTAAVRRGGA